MVVAKKSSAQIVHRTRDLAGGAVTMAFVEESFEEKGPEWSRLRMVFTRYSKCLLRS